MPLILASASASRKAMLEAAGVPFSSQPSTIDETSFKRRIADPRAVATELAKGKAAQVSMLHTLDWVVGSDSVIAVEGRRFDKPRTREEAAEHLHHFSGRPMELTSAVALARGGEIDWVHEETSRLNVRKLSPDFIEQYLEHEWPEVRHCVGVFRMEARGVQLFDRVEGDHFAILGMPLIPLLTALRDRGLIS